MKIILLIYLVSMLLLVAYLSFCLLWNNNDGGLKTRLIMTFTPVLNTLIVLVCLFYILPDEYIRKHKESEYEKHRTDVRWKLMNLKKYE
jgi:uncharacterized membrane protein (DUF485 family)